MIKQEEVYKIGKIGKPHGVKGEVSFMFEDDVFDRIDTDYLILEVHGILVPFFFDEYRFKSDSTALMKFCGIDSKEQAQELTGCDVFFPKKLSDRDENDLTWDEIQGFTLIDENVERCVIGTITSIDDSTTNILFNVRTTDGHDILVPAAEELILNVNAEKKEIRLKLPKGLLDLNA